MATPELLPQPKHLDRAKELLREQLAKHPDGDIRLLNDVADLPDDLPQVQRIAAALAAKEARP